MVQVVFVHSVPGLRAGVTGRAARLAPVGHPTVAPDLHGGRSTCDVHEGFRLRE